MRDRLAALAPDARETTVRVGLGERSYDIVIGERLLDEAGSRIAATLPGARCAVVSDANVAALYLRAAEGEPWRAFPWRGRGGARRAEQELPRARPSLRASARAWRRARRHGDRVGRRRGWRPCRLCREHPAARRPSRADADDPARPGRLLDRRQDRHRHGPRQESDRHLPPA